MIKTCPICGIAFEPTKHGQKYCSPECAEKAKRAAIKARRQKINQKLLAERHASWGWNTCAECGRVYAVTAANLKIVCSEECRKKRLARQIKEAHRKQTAKAWELAHPNQGTYEEHLKAKAAANKAIKDIEKAATEANRSAAQSKKARKAAQKRFEGKLKLYAAQGITYGEAQARDTIEKFARIDLGKGDRHDQ